MTVLVASIISSVVLVFPFLSDCDPLPNMANDCHVVVERPPINDIPLLTTWFNPLLCYEGFWINCGDEPMILADGLGWDESDFGNVAACPKGWHYLTVNFGEYSVLCRDRGGMINVVYSEYFRRWVIHIDVLSREAIPCNYCLYTGWSRARG